MANTETTKFEIRIRPMATNGWDINYPTHGIRWEGADGRERATGWAAFLNENHPEAGALHFMAFEVDGGPA